MSPWSTVTHTHILPVSGKRGSVPGSKHVLFVCKEAGVDHTTHELDNCCFEDFLSPTCYQTCGKGFAWINKNRKPIIPKAPLAFGVGTSAQYENGRFGPVLLRVNGQEITIKGM